MDAVRVWACAKFRRHRLFSRFAAHHKNHGDMGRGSFGTPRGRPDANAMAAQLEGLPRKDSQVDEPNSASSAAAVTTGAAVSGTRGDGGAAAEAARGASSTTSGAPARRRSAAAIQAGLVVVAIAVGAASDAVSMRTCRRAADPMPVRAVPAPFCSVRSWLMPSLLVPIPLISLIRSWRFTKIYIKCSMSS